MEAQGTARKIITMENECEYQDVVTEMKLSIKKAKAITQAFHRVFASTDSPSERANAVLINPDMHYYLMYTLLDVLTEAENLSEQIEA